MVAMESAGDNAIEGLGAAGAAAAGSGGAAGNSAGVEQEVSSTALERVNRAGNPALRSVVMREV